MPEFDFASLGKNKVEIIEQTKDLLKTRHIHEGKEYIAKYRRGQPCMSGNCEREFGSSQTACCPVCDGVMTPEEYDKAFTKPQEKGDDLRAMLGTPKKEEPKEDFLFGINEKGRVVFPEDPQTKAIAKHLGVQPKVTQKSPSLIMLFNGRHGSGKTTMAELFDTPFVMDCERGKDTDAIPYSNYEKIRNLRIGTMDDINAKKTDIDVVDVQGENVPEMWDNINKVIQWYISIGYKNHRTFVIGKGALMRSSRVAVEEAAKNRRITKFEYRPVTENNQELIYDLMKECRKKQLNLIIISHWDFKYMTIKNDSGYTDSEAVGEIPDVKEWIVRAVTWRVDFLKPEESGYEGKFVVYLDKAPRHQYAKIDITNKSLFEIINDLELFDKEVEDFKHIDEREASKGLEKLL
jgi:hypothetical protein